MTDTRAGAIIMFSDKPHVILAILPNQHVMTAPIKRRRATHHRADVQITMPGYGKAFASCGAATKHRADSLPHPIAYLDESITLALQVATRTETATRRAENDYQAVRQHTARGMNETRHER